MYMVGTFHPSISDVPKIAVRNDALVTGSFSAVASVRSRVWARVDVMEKVEVRSLTDVFVSLLICDGHLQCDVTFAFVQLRVVAAG